MAHAGYVSKGKSTMNDGKVDLARAGIAQSSMATVEVVRGVAQAQTPSSPRKKKRTLSFSFKALGNVVGKARGKGKSKEAETPAHLLEVLPLPVAFTAHIPPPSYVPSSYVLLQVFAVGIDSLDSLLVRDKVSAGLGAGKGKNSAGYIPGRSLVGRVIECGWEVNGDVCKKGEWVIGLLDVKKVRLVSPVFYHPLHCSYSYSIFPF